MPGMNFQMHDGKIIHIYCIKTFNGNLNPTIKTIPNPTYNPNQDCKTKKK